MPKRLFALFVGINEYRRRDAIRDLHGAELDARRMAAYLRDAATGIDFQPELLLGEEATRGRMIEGIQRHLAQAGSEDIALFYFSGHGVREQLPRAFQRANASRTMDALVCYDSYAERGIQGLANKELRFLLHEAAHKHPHLAVITDCCHSATATRGGFDPIRKTTETILDARPWEDFVFAEQLDPDQVPDFDALERVLPQARHLHLAACQSEQSAFELNREGFFTSHLLEVLRQSGGAVSYHQLRERVTSLIRSRTHQYDQTPGIYEANGSSLAQQAFLGLENLKHKVSVAVTVGQSKISINSGLIQGLPRENEQEELRISIFETDHPDRGQVAEAKLWHTGITDSEIRLLGNATLHKDRLYSALMSGLYQRDFNVAFWGSAQEEVKELIRSKFAGLFGKAIAERPGANTDGVVVLHNDRITLAHPDSDYGSLEEEKYLPLVRQLEGYSESNVAKLMGYLGHMARYNATRNIANRDSRLSAADVELRIRVRREGADDKEMVWNEADGCFNIELGALGEAQSAQLSFTVKNRSGRQLYFGLIYLTQLFGVYPHILDPAAMSISLDNGMSQQARLAFALEPFIVAYNRPYEKGLLRFFVATEAFNLQSLKQDDLPPPERVRGAAQRGEDRGVYKGIENRPDIPDWVVVDYPVRIMNPAYR